MTARIGAHLSGGIKGAAARARQIGLGVDGPGSGGPIQLWSRNPTAWQPARHAPADVQRFREQCAALDLWPIFTHGIYLMNFASPDDLLWQRSIEALVDHLAVGALLGAQAVIIHPGSGGSLSREAALDRCAAALRQVLARTDELAGRPLVALETCAGAGRTLGRTFADLAAIIERLDHSSAVAVALDTAHLFASGYDLASEAGLQATIDELLGSLAPARVIAIHANDSRAPLGSHRDRHENIGQGQIGEAAFARLLAHPLLRGLPWILEVPGYDGQGPDAQNLQALRRLAHSPVAAPAPAG